MESNENSWSDNIKFPVLNSFFSNTKQKTFIYVRSYISDIYIFDFFPISLKGTYDIKLATFQELL